MEIANDHPSFLSRSLFAFFPSFAMVILAMIAVNGEAIEWPNLFAGTVLALPIAIGSAALSAAFIRRIGVALLLSTELLTLVGIGLLNFLL
jgi:hypothetical protein